MAIMTKQLLSNSVNGKQIQITGTSTSTSTLIHSAVAGTTDIDEIWLYATNMCTSNLNLTLEWGGTTTGNLMVAQIPYQAGRYLVVDGKLLNSGLSVTAFANSGNFINIDGFVNRIDN